MFERESANIMEKLMIATGIEIHKETGILIDQDTKSQLTFNTKFIKACTDENSSIYISDRDVKLDPLDPKCTRIVETLFGKFLEDSSSPDIQNIPEVLTFFFDKNEESNKYQLQIRFENATKWVGNWYFNKIICYLEAIFSLDGTYTLGSDIDLLPFDVVREEE